MDASARPARTHHYETGVADSARWDAYRPRDGDIIVATAPKCGTTWTQMICALLVHGPKLPRPLTRLSPWLDRLAMPIDSVIEDLERQPWRRVIKTHTPLDGLPFFDNVDYVFCGRDVRDAFLSMIDNMTNTSASTLEEVRIRIGVPGDFAFPTDPNAFFPVWMTQPVHGWQEDGFPTGSVFAAARVFWRFRHLPNVHFTHYRDLSRDLGSEMRRLATALGIEVAESAWPDLLAGASFGAMSAQADDTAPGAHLGEWTSNRAFFAKARLDAWRDVLTEANQALYADLAPTRVASPLQAWLEGGGALAGDPKRL